MLLITNSASIISSSSSSNSMLFFFSNCNCNCNCSCNCNCNSKYKKKYYCCCSITSRGSSSLWKKTNKRLDCELIIPNYSNKKKRRRSWWQKFFLDEDANWLGFKDDDMQQYYQESSSDDSEMESEKDKFEEWKKRVEAITELREAQNDLVNEESGTWEDWLYNSNNNNEDDWDTPTPTPNGFGFGFGFGVDNDDYPLPPDPIIDDSLSEPSSIVRSVRNLLLRNINNDDDDDLLYEDRVFRYASTKSAQFLALLIIVPCALDFLIHDYVLMPFLDRYVKTVPLAAQLLDVRRSQKLEIIEELKMEKARLHLEVEIGKAPPLSDDVAWWELRDKALELRDEWRLHNRSAFANIWSDIVFGVSLFILLYFNQTKVALLKFTGYKIINNISDTGKAFLIILITDIFLGYHSESGWQTLLEVLVEHYGFEIDQSTLTIFICLVPVIFDACVKLWLFKFLPRLSPKVYNIFQEMKRH